MFTIVLMKVWAWLKKYWQLAVLVIGAAAAALFFREQEVGFAVRLKQIQDAHDAEIKAIDAARAEEEKQQAENQKRLQDALAAVQQQYDAAEKNLDDKKKKEVADIVAQYGDDPVELAKQLSAVTGFQVIMPG